MHASRLAPKRTLVWLPAIGLLLGLGFWGFTSLGELDGLSARALGLEKSVTREVTLVATSDSYLKDGSAHQNQSGETLLRVRSSGRNRALVAFNTGDLAAALAGNTLLSARLEFTVQNNGGNWGDGRTIDAHRVTAQWNESSVTWACPADSNLGNPSADCAAPWDGGTFEPMATDSVIHSNTTAGTVSFEVTADLEAALAGAPFHGWLLRKTDEGAPGLIDYASREVCGEEPRLVLELEAPAADTTAPRLVLTSPADRFLINPQQPPITLEFFDAGSALNLGSFEVRLDGAELSSTCTVCGARATCPAPVLAEGPHLISASIRDAAGNLATTSFAFDVLVGDGEHRLTLPAVADTYLRDGSPNQNQGGDTLLRIRSSGKNRALVRFDLSGVTELVDTLHSATLELSIASNGNNWGTTGRTVDAHALTAAWTELGATWNCAADTNLANSQPDCSPQWNGGSFYTVATDSLTVSNGLSGWVELDVTADVLAALAGDPHHGWLLKKTFENQNGLVEFTSKEGASSHAPRLVLTFDGGEAPDTTPPLLAFTEPAEGAVLTNASPTFVLSFSDVGTGVVTGSLVVLRNGSPLAVSCSFTTDTATCVPNEDLPEGTHSLSATVADGAGNVSTPATVSFTIDLPEPPDPTLPPDPSTVAPPLDRTVATDVFTATEFLYTGTNPIQTGVAPGTIDPRRVAVLRGRVLDRADQPLPGVTITVHQHPELGQTKSRADGVFDLVANGGGLLTLHYQKVGYLPLQRQIEARWQDYGWFEDVVMIPYDPEVTTVTATSPVAQVARGSLEADLNGSRRATLVIPAGTTFSLMMPDGSSQVVSSLSLRATEYTVGESGPEAMPGPLPPSVAYTYAVELSADEAVAAGARSVVFSQPVFNTLENFLDLPVGAVVPSGWYDAEGARWVGSDNGRVVQVLGLDGEGRATLDLDGNGLAATPAELAALGFSDEERRRLAELYAVGQSLWRVPIPHLTPWDHNLPYALPDDATSPQQDRLAGEGIDDDDEPDCTDGSIIECQNQTLRQRLEIVGTPFELTYGSDLMPGRTAAFTAPIEITGETVPASLKRAELEISIAGRILRQTYPPTPNQRLVFTWDGRDAYGRRVQGRSNLSIRKSYFYDLEYRPGVNLTRSWARFSVDEPLPQMRRQGGEIRVTTSNSKWVDLETRGSLGTFDAVALGLGGWTLSAHHVYDPTAQKLYLGDGRRQSATGLPPLLYGSVGRGESDYDGDGGPAPLAAISRPSGLAYGADGSLYIADRENQVIRRVSPQGIITTVAGNGNECPEVEDGDPTACGEGVLATEAMLLQPSDVAIAPNGDLLIADRNNNCVRRVDADGIIRTIAGQCDGGYGDGPLKALSKTGPALVARETLGCEDCPGPLAELRNPTSLAVAADGTVLISDRANHRIRALRPDGLLTTYAGGGPPVEGLGDGGPATEAHLFAPGGITLGADGSLFIAQSGEDRIRKVSASGTITTFAGNGSSNFCGDNGPAASACLSFPSDVAVAPDGSLLIADTNNRRIRKVSSSGIISTLAGSAPESGQDFTTPGSPSTGTALPFTTSVAVTPDGAVVFGAASQVLRIGGAFRGSESPEVVIPERGGDALFVFDREGRHLRTLDALTGVTRLEFFYDGQGLLSEVRDKNGLVTTLLRDGTGRVSVIRGPFGQVTTLTHNAAGTLFRFENPAGEAATFTYSAEGLMLSMTDPRGFTRHYEYASLGRLIRAEDGAGGVKTLTRTDNTALSGGQVRLVSPLGRTTSYSFSINQAGEVLHNRTDAAGGQTIDSQTRDGARNVRQPDLTTLELRRKADPRWGFEAPLPGEVDLSTPAGLTAEVSTSRAVVLADPDDPLSLVAQTDRVTVNGREFQQAYDASTRTLVATSAAGRTRTTELDVLGRPVSISIPGLAPLEITYDTTGRTSSLAQGSGAERRTLTLGYDASGWLASLTDPLGHNATLTRDAAGRVVEALLPGGRVLELRQDAHGNTTSITPPSRPAHTFGYTPVDLPATYQAPVVGETPAATTYSHNLDHQLTQQVAPGGEAVNLSYDSAGRASLLSTPEGAYGITYVPQTSKLATLSSPDGVTLAYSYDGFLLTATAWSGPISGQVARTFNNDFRLTEERVNGAHPASFTYDDDGLLTQAGATALTHHAGNGLLESATVGAVTTTWSRNTFGEIAGSTSVVGASPLLSQSYSRDKLGRIVEKVETIEGVTSTFTYSYDVAGRLSEVTRDGVVTATYTYDPNGNRLSYDGTFGAAPATYDAQDRLIQYGDTTYTFDAKGDLTSKSANGQTVAYDTNALGGLAGVTLASGIEIDYLLDGRGRRVGKKINGAMVQGFLHRDSLRLSAELDASGAVTSRFVYGSRFNLPDTMEKAGVTYAFLADHLGSPRLVINTTTGAIAQRLDYDEYGRVILDTNPGFQPFGFAGGLYDPQTGLVRFGARDYDPEVGRWTAKDPIGFGGGSSNLYEYVGNDPVNYYDPTGLTSCDEFVNMLSSLINAQKQSDAALGAAMLVESRKLRGVGQSLSYDGFKTELVSGGQNGEVWAHVVGAAGTALLGATGRAIFSYQLHEDTDQMIEDGHPQGPAEVLGNLAGREVGEIMRDARSGELSREKAVELIHDLLCQDDCQP